MTTLGARHNVSRHYSAQHLAHDAAAVLSYANGEQAEGNRHHAAAVACAWSLESEMTNRPVEPRPWGCKCAMCSQYLFRALS